MGRIIIKIASPNDAALVAACEEIAKSHSAQSGGTLHFTGLVADSDVLILATEKGKVIGYLALKSYPFLKNSLYIEQIAVDKDHLHQGVGKELVKRAQYHCMIEGEYTLICNCRKENKASNALFRSLGFKLYKMALEKYLALGFDSKDIPENNAYRNENKLPF